MFECGGTVVCKNSYRSSGVLVTGGKYKVIAVNGSFVRVVCRYANMWWASGRFESVPKKTTPKKEAKMGLVVCEHAKNCTASCIHKKPHKRMNNACASAMCQTYKSFAKCIDIAVPEKPKEESVKTLIAKKKKMEKELKELADKIREKGSKKITLESCGDKVTLKIEIDENGEGKRYKLECEDVESGLGYDADLTQIIDKLFEFYKKNK